MKHLIIVGILTTFFTLLVHPNQPAFAGFEMDGEGNVEEKRK